MKRCIAVPVIFVLGILIAACGTSPATIAPTTIAPTTQGVIVAPTSAFTPVPDIGALATRVAQGQHDTVTSADGKVTLLIPHGALPANTAASAISIQPISATDSSLTALASAPLAAYQLLPDGLHFSTPAIIQIVTDSAPSNHVVALASLAGETLIPLNPTRADVDPHTGKVTLTAPIAHFSDVVVHESGFTFTLSGGSSNGDEAVNAPFQANAAVFRYSADPPALGGVLAANVATPTPKDGALSTWSLDGTWQATSALSPTLVQHSPSQSVTTNSGIVVASNQQFTCTKVSASEDVAYLADLTFTDYSSNYQAGQGIVQSDFNDHVIEVLHLPVNCKQG